MKVQENKPTIETELRVMFFDTDAAKMVHNIAYLRFIETNRSLLAEKLGWTLEEMIGEGPCPVVVRTEIDYRSAAFLGDVLVVRGWLEEYSKVRFWCGFTIVRPLDGKTIVNCRQMLALISLPDMKPRVLPVHWDSEFKHLKKS
jgi:YbgC/YbaW family acyl-CoA thioester hydrolase